jgi:hypothetical protein
MVCSFVRRSVVKVIIKIDISNSFNTTDRTLTFDVLSGRGSRDCKG